MGVGPVDEAWISIRGPYMQKDIIRVTDLPSATLQNWANRKLFGPMENSPREAAKRTYTGATMIMIALGADLVTMGIQPNQAFKLSRFIYHDVLDEHLLAWWQEVCRGNDP